MMARLSVSLLGSFKVTLDGEPVTYKYDKVLALLAYLVVEADRAHRRDVLAALLWPDYPNRVARTNLRNALSSLRKAIGDRARSGDRVRSGDRDAVSQVVIGERITGDRNGQHLVEIGRLDDAMSRKQLSVCAKE